MLKFIDPGKSYILRTDASDKALGAVLSQIDENNQEAVVACASRTLKGSEVVYTMTEKELLSIVW